MNAHSRERSKNPSSPSAWKQPSRKQKILERYLNDVYLGQRGTYEVRGIAAASRHYLDKESGALRPAEVAVLVGLIRSPNTTSPLVSLQHARKRRDLVFRRLREEWRLASPSTGTP